MIASFTLRFERVDDLVLLVHGEQHPSSAEWDAYIAWLEARLGSSASPAVLVVTDGASPNATQRAALNDLVTRLAKPAPTAVLSNSPAVRGVVGVLGLWNRAIRAFRPDELDAALQHVGAKPARRAEILERIVRMRLSLSSEAELPEGKIDLRGVARDMESVLAKRLPALREALRQARRPPP